MEDAQNAKINEMLMHTRKHHTTEETLENQLNKNDSAFGHQPAIIMDQQWKHNNRRSVAWW
jgi:hypothetical protein